LQLKELSSLLFNYNENRLTTKTSINYLNGDNLGGMNWVEKKMYFSVNKISNSFFPNKIYNDLVIKKNNPLINENHWGKLGKTDTPSRKLCDLFWMNLPWSKIKTELGQINVFDSGCGNGEYANKISKWSNYNINEYHGIDLLFDSNWDKLKNTNDKFNFQICDYLNVENCIKENTNLIITQSAIEHFKYDLFFFNKIYKLIENYKQSTIQIHLFPSSPCLKLYGFHGYRQYTRRKSSIIFDIFKNNSEGVLFELGGRNCNELHYNYITKQINNGEKEKRYIETNEYNYLLKNAITKDYNNTKDRNPSFYALIIHSYPKDKTIFTPE